MLLLPTIGFCVQRSTDQNSTVICSISRQVASYLLRLRTAQSVGVHQTFSQTCQAMPINLGQTMKGSCALGCCLKNICAICWNNRQKQIYIYIYKLYYIYKRMQKSSAYSLVIPNHVWSRNIFINISSEHVWCICNWKNGSNITIAVLPHDAVYVVSPQSCLLSLIFCPFSFKPAMFCKQCCNPFGINPTGAQFMSQQHTHTLIKEYDVYNCIYYSVIRP